jgi:hypothetical protein
MLAIIICETFKLVKNVASLQQCCILVAVCSLMSPKSFKKGVFEE